MMNPTDNNSKYGYIVEEEADKDFLVYNLPKIKLPWYGWPKVRLHNRAFQAATSFIIFITAASCNIQQIKHVNYLYGISSYQFLIANGVLIWVYTSTILLLNLKFNLIRSQIPQDIYERFDGKGDLIEVFTDMIFMIFSFSGATSALNALYTSTCGGDFPVDECYTLDDVCKMRARGNPAFAGAPCARPRLQAAAIMTFLLILTLGISLYGAWRSLRCYDFEQDDALASLASHPNHDSRRTSLEPLPSASAGLEMRAGRGSSGSGGGSPRPAAVVGDIYSVQAAAMRQEEKGTAAAAAYHLPAQAADPQEAALLQEVGEALQRGSGRTGNNNMAADV